MIRIKQLVLLLLVALTISSCVNKAQKEDILVYSNPLPVQFGDPYVLLASDGLYYMYGTGGGAVDAIRRQAYPGHPGRRA